MPAALEIPLIALGLALIVGGVATRESGSPAAARGAQLVWLVGLALALVGYFREGDIVPGDGHSHLARTYLTFDVIRHGSAPTWSNRWYLGFPLDLHYGPLYYLLAAAFAWAFGSVFLGTKVFLYTLHVASGLAMYGYAERRYRDPIPAMLLGTAYAISSFHYGFVRGSGYLPLSIIFLVLPLAFRTLEDVRDAPFRLPPACYAGLLLTTGLVAHLQYGAYVILAYFLALGVVARSSSHRSGIARHAVVVLLATFTLTAWFTVPLLVERAFLVLDNEPLLVRLPARDTAQNLLHLVQWSREWRGWSSAYIGLSIVVLAAVGLASKLHGRPAAIDAAGASRAPNATANYPMAIGALGLCGMVAGQPRMVLLLFFALVTLVGDGYVALKRFFSRRLAIVVLFVIIADVGLMLHQPALIHYVPPAFTQAWSATAPARVLTLHGNSRTWWPSRDVTSEVSSPMGGIPQLAPKTSYGYTCSILALAAKELIDDGSAPSAATVALLRLMNVREVVIPSMARRLTIPNPEPVVFASRVGVAGRDARLESLGMAARGAFERREIPTEFVTRVAQEMELASGRPLAERILVAGPDTPPQVAQSNASVSAVTFTVFDFMEAHDRVSFRYRADRPGYLRLAYSYFPDTRVRIDGHDARIWPDALGTMVVGGREGEHSVEVVFGRSPLRAALFALSLFGAFGLWLAVRFTSPRSMSQHTVSGS